MPHYVYILYSLSRDRYYIGSASELEERLIRHNAGATPSTKPGRYSALQTINFTF